MNIMNGYYDARIYSPTTPPQQRCESAHTAVTGEPLVSGLKRPELIRSRATDSIPSEILSKIPSETNNYGVKKI